MNHPTVGAVGYLRVDGGPSGSSGRRTVCAHGLRVRQQAWETLWRTTSPFTHTVVPPATECPLGRRSHRVEIGQAGRVLPGVLETDDGWTLPFAGSGVAQVAVDHRVTLRLGGGDDIVLGSRFTLGSPDGSGRSVDPAQWSDAARAVAVVHQIVRSASVRRSGELDIEFHDGHSIRSTASEEFEAWEVVFKDGRMIVALPGGEVTTFGPNA